MPEGEVALALAELRRIMETGFARIDGQIALLVQRTDQNDKVNADLDARVTALEKARWPLPTVAVLASVVAVILVLVQTTGG